MLSTSWCRSVWCLLLKYAVLKSKDKRTEPFLGEHHRNLEEVKPRCSTRNTCTQVGNPTLVFEIRVDRPRPFMTKEMSNEIRGLRDITACYNNMYKAGRNQKSP